VTRDRKYSLTSNVEECQVLYFSANPNGEAETITVFLRPTGSIKKLKWDIDFADILIKGRGSKGNLVSKHSVKKIEFKDSGKSTLKPRELWYDSITRRLNSEDRGEYLGAFKGDDLLLIVTSDGMVKTVTPDLALHMPDNLLRLEKWIPAKPLSVFYYEGERERYFLKRFLIEQELKEDLVISETKGSELIAFLTDYRPVIRLEFVKPRGKDPLPDLTLNVEDFISVKGIKALGNQVTTDKIKQVHVEDPLPYEEAEAVKDETDESNNKGSNDDADAQSEGGGELTLF
jgi:topoisomerase-4 subunit A